MNALAISQKNKAIQILGGKCVNCGSTERLQFDHINNDRDGQLGLISYLIRMNWGRLVKELNKCQLLCISCHAIKTGIDRSTKEAVHGLASTYNNRGCRCVLCKAANTEHTRQFRGKKVE